MAIKKKAPKKKPRKRKGNYIPNATSFKPGHRYSIGGGRKPVYETPEELQEEINNFFEYIKGEFHEVEREAKVGRKMIKIKERIWDREPEPATITGLFLFLGFASRQSMLDYKAKDALYSDIIVRGKARVEHAYENRLHSQHVNGAIFALQNIAGWQNKKDVQNLGKDGKPVDPPAGVIITTMLQNTKKDI